MPKRKKHVRWLIVVNALVVVFIVCISSINIYNSKSVNEVMTALTTLGFGVAIGVNVIGRVAAARDNQNV